MVGDGRRFDLPQGPATAFAFGPAPAGQRESVVVAPQESGACAEASPRRREGENGRIVGLDAATSQALAPRWKDRAVRDPGKILLDVALAVALSGDRLVKVGLLRGIPPCSGWWPPTRPSPRFTLVAGHKRAVVAIRTARPERRFRGCSR
ncbi:hypothetical protein GCM10023086_75870 [Streptomyces venetus]|uniref:Uncharacterized protein n=1 Tax=Streptomyces venetus TaxID=1701086 RepID=A0ABP8HK65_9ACTN